MTTHRFLIRILTTALSFLFIGCTGLYFRDAGKPPAPPPRFDLFDWPYEEYWTGIVFNGAKVGFTHFKLSPGPPGSGCFDVRSEAVLRIRFLGFDKKIHLKSFDRVAGDLSLQHFEYDYDLDGNRLVLDGRVENNRLEVRIVTRGRERLQRLPVDGPVYTTGIVNLYPLLHGLDVGRSYLYPVYDGETQTISPVTQKVVAFEKSDLFAGRAYKIITRLHGQEVSTWMSAGGEPLLEMSMGGVIIAELESRSTAEKYLAQAALNKSETLLDFSLIKSDTPIVQPHRLACLEVVIEGIEAGFEVPSDDRQQCRNSGGRIFCRIEPVNPESSAAADRSGAEAFEKYLTPSYIISSFDPKIRRKAAEIAAKADGALTQVRLLLEWMRNNVEQEPVDVFSALDVLETGKAECQGHAFLFAAFARSLGIPTRVVNGVVFSEQHQGFLYHTWVESRIGGRWTAVDPTFGQVPADATHIKFIEGENLSDLIPMANLIGKIKLKITSAKTPEEEP